MNKFNDILNRFNDPGSIRSLVLFIFMLKGIAIDEGTADMIANVVIAAIAFYSFLMKPKAPPEVVTAVATTAVVQAQEATSTVKEVANKVESLADTVGGLVNRLKKD